MYYTLRAFVELSTSNQSRSHLKLLPFCLALVYIAVCDKSPGFFSPFWLVGYELWWRSMFSMREMLFFFFILFCFVLLKRHLALMKNVGLSSDWWSSSVPLEPSSVCQCDLQTQWPLSNPGPLLSFPSRTFPSPSTCPKWAVPRTTRSSLEQPSSPSRGSEWYKHLCFFFPLHCVTSWGC